MDMEPIVDFPVRDERGSETEGIETALHALSHALRDNRTYKEYMERKAEVYADPCLLEKIREFKRMHLHYQTQILQNEKPSFQEEQAVSRLYSEMMQSDRVGAYLKSEETLLQIYARVRTVLREHFEIDMDF